jgi:hypothetical protein
MQTEGEEKFGGVMVQNIHFEQNIEGGVVSFAMQCKQ